MSTRPSDVGVVPLDGTKINECIGPLPINGVRVPVPAIVFSKRAVDLAASLLALPAIALAGLTLMALNPIWNPGPLFYRQVRMGRDCKPFTAIKFRTMRCTPAIMRGPNDPVEDDRITRLGAFLRKSRIDEWPQFLNVLAGDMSLIGPRPDYWDHAVHYLQTVPGYRERHAMRPGITGLAQVDDGYAEGIESTFRKVRYDLFYIERTGFRMEAYIIMRTLSVLFTGAGAR
ncbi:sugar transferase [Limibaculum sp. M0105]|uniref:Sugar transferase n=1 Tax=Thermohalobaculum xanthum TaxID=2753746 RepID=A0A8J7M7S0_9RHOB|nr:sugar transferase [Thermohalobaculum xanthum]MBK0399775.1 sugar transferase [Thermohalobaculum xanthum]